MSRRARIIGIGRADEWEYPQEALREVIVNALMHRDYGPLARGSQVRIEMYPDRLVVTSPGGLHGNVDEADLMSEPVTSSRNAHLAKLLEDVVEPGTRRTVCENRGSGLLALADALRRAGMTPPTIRADLKTFEVTLYNHALLDDEALAWLQRIGAGGCSDTQKRGLAAARRDGTVTLADYRVVTGLDALAASRELSSLAQAGFLERDGGRRFAVWALVERPESVGAAEPPPALPVPEQERIREALLDGPRSATEIAGRLGLSKQAVLATVREMRLAGLVAPTEEKLRSPKNKWQLAPRIPGDDRLDPNAGTGA
jgi:ATP-dependent DNA helicase RecG